MRGGSFCSHASSGCTGERWSLWCEQHGFGRAVHCKCIDRSTDEGDLWEVAKECSFHNWAWLPGPDERPNIRISGGSKTNYDIYKKLGTEIGELVASKQVQYGDSAGRAGRILAVLYPNGVPVHAYDDALLIVRCLDKFSRIAQRGENGKDLGDESPYGDLAGYALLGLAKDRAK